MSRLAEAVLPWLAAQVRARPLLVGVNGPQGCGKSTLCGTLVSALRGQGRRAVAVSIDDFYLPREAQLALAAAHPGNPYLEHRGYPGTHDVALGTATLARLREPGPQTVALPLYDKSAHGGRGDRAPRDGWPAVTTPLDVVLVEGWMLGFRPVPPETLEDPRLAPANEALRHYAPWHRDLDALIHLRAARLEHIVAWRVDAERARRAMGAPALTEDEARDYILRFLPAYRTWGPGLEADPGLTGPVFRAVLGADRDPLETSTRPALGLPESPRLRFGFWDPPRDLALGRALWADPEVMRFLNKSGPLDDTEIEARLRREAENLHLHGVQYWPIFLRESGEPVGCCGLKPKGEVLELGFHLRPAFWGRGLGTEAANAVVRYASEVLRVPELFAGHHPQNEGSRAVLLKLGFLPAEAEYFPPTGLVHPGYRLRLR